MSLEHRKDHVAMGLILKAFQAKVLQNIPSYLPRYQNNARSDHAEGDSYHC
jgi:hypothetical protein